jgi:hypothetical protein
MKKLFGFLLLCIALLCVDAFPAGGFIPDSMATISKAKSMNAYIFSSAVKPFGWGNAINVSSTDWTCPDSIWTKAIYCASFANVKVQLRSGDTMTIPIDSLCGLPLDLKKIYKLGTDSLKRSGTIKVFGDRAY